MSAEKVEEIAKRFEAKLKIGDMGVELTFPSSGEAIKAVRELARTHMGPIKGPDSKNMVLLVSKKGLL